MCVSVSLAPVAITTALAVTGGPAAELAAALGEWSVLAGFGAGLASFLLAVRVRDASPNGEPEGEDREKETNAVGRGDGEVGDSPAGVERAETGGAEEGDAAIEAALERERRISDGIIDAVPGLFVLADAEGRLLRWNDAFAQELVSRCTGVSGSSQTLTDVFDDEHTDRLHALCRNALETGEDTAHMPLHLPDECEQTGASDAQPTKRPYRWTARRVNPANPDASGPEDRGDGSSASSHDRSDDRSNDRFNDGSNDGDGPYLALTGVSIAERIETEEALEKKQEQYQFVVDNVADVITRHAPDTTCTFATPSVESLLGYEPDELVGRSCIDLVHPEDRPQTWDNISRALDGEVVKRRARLKHKDGHYVWVEMTSRLWSKSGTGGSGDIVVSSRNVTDQVLAEEALQESEERLRQLAENVEGVFWLRTADEYLYVSPAYERIWGRPVEHLYDNPEAYVETIHPEDRQRVVETLQDGWEDGEMSMEYRIVRPDGSVRWVHSMAGQVPMDDGPDRFAGYAVDVTPQKAQEQALRESEERWRRLVETHMEPIMISVEGIIRYINPSGAELLGADDPDEIIGRDLRDFAAESYRSDVDERLKRLDAGEPTEPFEHRMRRLDGETRIVESYSVPIQYDGERAAQTVIRDITEWRAAQSKLEYRVLLENLIVDLSTRFIDTEADLTDDRIEDALGRVGPFVGADRSYVFLFDNEAGTLSNTHEWCGPGVEEQKEMIQDVPQSRFPWLMRQLRTQRAVHVPDVSALPATAAEEQAVLMAQNIQSLILVPMTDGRKLIGFAGFDAVKQQRTWETETIMLLRVLADTFANALARKDAEQALREREAQYRTVVENVRDVVFQTDTEGRWTFLNPAWEALTGYSVDDTLGNPCLAYLEGPDLERLRNDVIEGDADSCRSEVKLRTSDGSVRWMALFARPLREDESGSSRTTGVVGTLHDITERKRMEQQTREALRRERELNRLKSSVVSMVSHEFRTPLSTIRSSAEMLGEFFDQWSQERRDKHIQRIHTQIDRMSRLLGDVITTSKLDARHEEPTLTSLDLRRFQQETTDEVRAHLGTDREVDVRMENVPQMISADPDLLHHVLSNLLSNALKYSPEDTAVEVGWTIDDDTLHLEVRDHGIGIPESDQEHLFRAFFRASNVEGADGSGLGTTIVKRAVDVYGGTIRVDSEEGEGTTFHVTLPLGD